MPEVVKVTLVSVHRRARGCDPQGGGGGSAQWGQSKATFIVTISGVGRESRDGKFPGIPGFLAFPFPGNSGPGSREKEPHELGLFQANFEGKGVFNEDTFL